MRPSLPRGVVVQAVALVLAVVCLGSVLLAAVA